MSLLGSCWCALVSCYGCFLNPWSQRSMLLIFTLLCLLHSFIVLMCFPEPLYIAFTDTCEMLMHVELFLFSFFSDRSPTKLSYFSEHHSFVSQAFWDDSEYWVICIACKQCPNAGIIWLWVNQTDFLTRAVTVSDFYHRRWWGVVYIYIYIILKLNRLLTNVRVYFSTSVSEHSACKTLK